ncbi:LamG-like jellyroll fold domain-containing protein [Longispora albida]|uniref:LamG-like jellyroll fold domain-containing protein n=1 Tax=Longispora albida TaxID=203523 RepID=UPI000363E878|nr:LamG-like jellyroll fold domain-containing protein [Longispora albida]
MFAMAVAAVTAAIVIPAPASANPVGGAHLWLRADVGVTVNGTSVSAWLDQSGNARNGTMSLASRQPQLVQGQINGLPVIRFSGAQSLGLTSPVNPYTFTVFVVGKNSKTSGFSMILGPGGNYANNQLRWENSSQALLVGTGNSFPAVTSNVGSTMVYHALSATYDGSTLRVYRDGALTSTHTFATSGGWTLAQIGAWYSSYFMVGDLAEVIVYPTKLSDTDRQTTGKYLGVKYNLPW